jgi:hypothetical protein
MVDDHVFEENRTKETGASLPEVKLIDSVIKRHRLPSGVKTWSAEYGEDSTGEPAVWIWFHYKDDEGISQQKIHELSGFVHLISVRPRTN